MKIIIYYSVLTLLLSSILIVQKASGQIVPRVDKPIDSYTSGLLNNIGISITHSYDLEFGTDLFPGVDRIIYPTDPGGRGGFQVEGAGGKEVSVTFILPVYLSDGPNQLDVSFSGNYAGHGTNPMGSNLTLFNPQAGTQIMLSSMPNYIFIGGRAIPSSMQPSGTYTGQIIMQVEYTGN